MRVLRNLSNDRLGMAALIVIAMTLTAGICAPWLAPHDPLAVNMRLRYAGPSWAHWLGNDHLGRCLLSRLLYGIRPSVLWVMLALFVSVAIGAVVGFAAGYLRGRIDAALMRICDVMLAFPGYVMTLAIVGMLGPGLDNILIAFAAMKWPWFARIIRTSVMQYSDMDYVKFARLSGSGPLRVMRMHLLPMTFADVAVLSSTALGSMILQVSGLSFLGLGIQAPHAEWGMMLNEASEVMFSRPELMLAPGVAVVVVVSAFNFLADALQTALDPKLLTSRQRLRRRKVEAVAYEYTRG
ncbi:staphylopine uptake ABC transporter permease subunit CntC [Paenibacillus xanthanilyticus]|uniref:Staphylopine uptake ABC transporter permease subunit CntC n=1 Tax=Paenibacillus xanthanilyticus TaxID=1783531 RepID=A0ABV8K0A0_9BACL